MSWHDVEPRSVESTSGCLEPAHCHQEALLVVVLSVLYTVHSFALTEIILASLAFPKRRRLEIAGGWGCQLGVMLVPMALFIICKTGEMVDTLVRTCQLSSHPTQ